MGFALRKNRLILVIVFSFFSINSIAQAREHKVTRDEAIAIAASELGKDGVTNKEVKVEENRSKYKTQFPTVNFWWVYFHTIGVPDGEDEFIVDQETGKILLRTGCC